MRLLSLTLTLATFALAGAACGRVDSDDVATNAGDGSTPAADASNPETATFDASTFGDASTDALRIDASIGSCGELLANRDVLEQFVPSRMLGVYTVLQKDEECSGAGGTHITFELHTPCAPNSAPKLVHWGGHACHTARAFHVGDPFVVAFEPVDLPDPTPGWCIDALPPSTAKARWIDGVGTVDQGFDQLRGLGCPLPLGGP